MLSNDQHVTGLLLAQSQIVDLRGPQNQDGARKSEPSPLTDHSTSRQSIGQLSYIIRDIGLRGAGCLVQVAVGLEGSRHNGWPFNVVLLHLLSLAQPVMVARWVIYRVTLHR